MYNLYNINLDILFYKNYEFYFQLKYNKLY